MICDRCGKREASIFIRREGADGFALCEICAREQGITAEDGRLHISLEELFSPTLGAREQVESRRVCPLCGTRLEEIRKSGRVGCPACFSSFRMELLSYLKRRGRPAGYVGRVPRRFASSHCFSGDSREAGKSVKADEVSDWERELQEALASEDYERAARMRDRIQGARRAKRE